MVKHWRDLYGSGTVLLFCMNPNSLPSVVVLLRRLSFVRHVRPSTSVAHACPRRALDRDSLLPSSARARSQPWVRQRQGPGGTCLYHVKQRR